MFTKISFQILNDSNWIWWIERTYEDENEKILLSHKSMYFDLDKLASFQTEPVEYDAENKVTKYSLELYFTGLQKPIKISSINPNCLLIIKILSIAHNVSFKEMKHKLNELKK